MLCYRFNVACVSSKRHNRSRWDNWSSVRRETDSSSRLRWIPFEDKPTILFHYDGTTWSVAADGAALTRDGVLLWEPPWRIVLRRVVSWWVTSKRGRVKHVAANWIREVAFAELKVRHSIKWRGTVLTELIQGGSSGQRRMPTSWWCYRHLPTSLVGCPFFQWNTRHCRATEVTWQGAHQCSSRVTLLPEPILWVDNLSPTRRQLHQSRLKDTVPTVRWILSAAIMLPWDKGELHVGTVFHYKKRRSVAFDGCLQVTNDLLSCLHSGGHCEKVELLRQWVVAGFKPDNIVAVGL